MTHRRGAALRSRSAAHLSPLTAKTLLDYDGKTIWMPKDEALRPATEFLRRKIAPVT